MTVYRSPVIAGSEATEDHEPDETAAVDRRPKYGESSRIGSPNIANVKPINPIPAPRDSRYRLQTTSYVPAAKFAPMLTMIAASSSRFRRRGGAVRRRSASFSIGGDERRPCRELGQVVGGCRPRRSGAGRLAHLEPDEDRGRDRADRAEHEDERHPAEDRRAQAADRRPEEQAAHLGRRRRGRTPRPGARAASASVTVAPRRRVVHRGREPGKAAQQDERRRPDEHERQELEDAGQRGAGRPSAGRAASGRPPSRRSARRSTGRQATPRRRCPASRSRRRGRGSRAA